MVNGDKKEQKDKGKKGRKCTMDKKTRRKRKRDEERAQYMGYTLKSEASLTGFAMSPRIARTLQRCENFTCARVFPTSISTSPPLSLSPTPSIYFFLLTRQLIPRLIAHAEQTIFFFYYFVRVRVVRFVSIKFFVCRLTIVRRPKDSKTLDCENPIRTQSKSNICEN